MSAAAARSERDDKCQHDGGSGMCTMVIAHETSLKYLEKRAAEDRAEAKGNWDEVFTRLRTIEAFMSNVRGFGAAIKLLWVVLIGLVGDIALRLILFYLSRSS